MAQEASALSLRDKTKQLCQWTQQEAQRAFAFVRYNKFTPEWHEREREMSWYHWLYNTLMQHMYCLSNRFNTLRWSTTKGVTWIWTQQWRCRLILFILYVSDVGRVLTGLPLMVTSVCFCQRQRLTELWHRHKMLCQSINTEASVLHDHTVTEVIREQMMRACCSKRLNIDYIIAWQHRPPKLYYIIWNILII